MSMGAGNEVATMIQMKGMFQAPVRLLDISRLTRYVGAQRQAALMAQAAQVREAMAGRVLWNVNSTATGGGLAEMLAQLVAYATGAGVDTRWLVAEGHPDFFAIMKQVRNGLYGDPGDGGELGRAEQRVYRRSPIPTWRRCLLAIAGPPTRRRVEQAARAGAPPVLAGVAAHAGRRRERCHRQRHPALRGDRGTEEPHGGVRAHRLRGDVEGTAGRRHGRRRNPGPDPARG